jgi:hypothetical protein
MLKSIHENGQERWMVGNVHGKQDQRTVGQFEKF